MQYTYVTNGKTCTNSIKVDLDEANCVKDIVFLGGGCQGNLTALKSVLVGKDANWIIEHFKGILCGNRGTSCADQLALCMEEAMNANKAGNPKDCHFYTGNEVGYYKHECIYTNDVCENNLDCIYRADKARYEEIVKKLELSNSSVL